MEIDGQLTYSFIDIQHHIFFSFINNYLGSVRTIITSLGGKKS
jgi:hypothetical protein